MWSAATMKRFFCSLLVAFNYTGILESVEFCQFEAFDAGCSAPGHVILIDSAHYGRLAIGRCVTRDYGHMGCSVDVYRVINEICSGRVHCRVPVPHLRHLIDSPPCPADLTAYLEVAYHCVPVIELGSLACNETISITGTNSSLFVSSASIAPAVAVDNNVIPSPAATVAAGLSQACPIQFEVGQGQTVTMTLLTFTLRMPKQAIGERRMCPMRATVTDGLRVKTVPLCGLEGSRQLIHRSQLSHVRVYFTWWPPIQLAGDQLLAVDRSVEPSYDGPSRDETSVDSATGDRMFLLEIAVVGCPDVRAEEGQWFERDGDRLLLGCNSTQQVVQLTCIKTSWIGKRLNCTSTSIGTHAGIGLAVTIGTFIGVACGLSLLVFVFVRGHRRQHVDGLSDLDRRRLNDGFSKYTHVTECLLMPPGEHSANEAPQGREYSPSASSNNTATTPVAMTSWFGGAAHYDDYVTDVDNVKIMAFKFYDSDRENRVVGSEMPFICEDGIPSMSDFPEVIESNPGVLPPSSETDNA